MEERNFGIWLEIRAGWSVEILGVNSSSLCSIALGCFHALTVLEKPDIASGELSSAPKKINKRRGSCSEGERQILRYSMVDEKHVLANIANIAHICFPW
jgi:hypothetical protein